MNRIEDNKDFAKQFSSWVTEEGLAIDIYSGIKELYKAVLDKDQVLAEDAYYKTGMAFIKQQVVSRLGRFADNVMVEYSLVASTLDPDYPNTLQCCSFVITDKDDTSGFKKAISEKYSSCIDKVSTSLGYSIYQHPHFLYDIPKEKDSTIWENNKNARSKYILTKVTRNDASDNTIISESVSEDTYISLNSKNLSVGVFPLSRSYSEMIRSAQEWTKNKENNNKEAKSLKKLQRILHQVCFYNISNRSNDINSSYYISFPIFGAVASNQLPLYKVGDGSPLQGIGACFIYFEPQKDVTIIDDLLHEQVSKLVYSIGDVIRFISVNYLFNLGLQLQERARAESIKSAKAAIMSRNMSHNLGSHVMAYLKQQLGSVTTILNKENKVLAELLPGEISINGEKIKIDESFFATNDVELPFLVGLGRFIGYLQERQDYVATISTDYIPYGAPVNLKDAIYDELNPDLRYLRHKVDSNKNADNESDAKNRPANILLNYIAKSEGLSRENMKDDFSSQKDIRFGFIGYTDENKKGKTFGFTSFNSADEVLSQMRKINISLPGGLVGRQAIFSIIENLIRNAAKHGDTSQVENLDFTLDLIDGSDVIQKKCISWNERITDQNWRILYENASDIEDVYILTITDNLPCKQEVAKMLCEGLNESFVDYATGKMTTANKGIKEIRISAAWLRGETNEDLYFKYGEKDKKALAPLVAVELSANGNLRYMICIRKNKTVAVIPSVMLNQGTENGKIIKMDEVSISLFKKLHEQDKDCWSILSVEELLNNKFSYSFILIPDDENAYNSLRPKTSNRLFKWKVSDENIASLDSSEDALIRVFQLFTGLTKQSEDLFIDDGTASMENELREANEERKHFNKIRFDADKIDYSSPTPIYLYKTHLSNAKDYKKFAKTDHYGSHECAEGITGDNSSDRLIRREWLDEKWYYTHLYALKRKVAIIDERIFKMVHSIDEHLFVGYNDDVSIKDLCSMVKKGQITEKALLDKITANYSLFNLSEEKKEQLLWAPTLENVSNIISSVPHDIVKSLINNTRCNKIVKGNNHLTPYFNGKGVNIFTVVLGAEGKMMLVGCVKSLYNGNSFENTFEKIASFERDGNGQLVLTPVEKYASIIENQFDYISIHQGILDKIYENLGIKRNSCAKCELTACIHQRLMKDTTTIGDYLPRFVIHSGRAKPTVEDMPQKQPFVQYAAIENAVKDCKPMLVELLDYAKYEDN